jgi:hypothetical protein
MSPRSNLILSFHPRLGLPSGLLSFLAVPSLSVITRTDLFNSGPFKLLSPLSCNCLQPSVTAYNIVVCTLFGRNIHFLGFTFSHEDGGILFMSNTGKRLADFVMSQQKVQYPLQFYKGEVNRNWMLLCLFHSPLHVSATTGHPQVEYTKVIFPGAIILQRIRCFSDFRRRLCMWCTKYSINFLHFRYNVKIIN